MVIEYRAAHLDEESRHGMRSMALAVLCVPHSHGCFLTDCVLPTETPWGGPRVTESVNFLEPDLIEAVAEYMARYEEGSGRIGDKWENREIREVWRNRARSAIDTAAEFIFSQSGHCDAPAKDIFRDLHEVMAMSMYRDETNNDCFQHEDQRHLWRLRARWAMIALGEAVPLYAEHRRLRDFAV